MNCHLCGQPMNAVERTRWVVIGPPDAVNLSKLKQGKPHSAPVAKAHQSCPGPVTLTCVCCGWSETLKDCEVAFQAGWDEPNHLPSWPLCCPLCPGVGAMGMVDHSAAHKRWESEGRPAEFETRDLPLP